MVVLAVWRWVLGRVLASPLALGVMLALGLGVPLLRDLRPFTSGARVWDQARPWALPAGLLGACLALVTLSEARPFLERLDPRTRLVGEGGAVGLGALLLQLPIWGAVLWVGAPLSDLGAGLAAILTLDAHLAGIALLTLLPPLPNALRASLFLTVVWLVPALTAAEPTLAHLSAWIDVRAPLRAAAPDQLLPGLASACALALTAALLRTVPTRETPG